jgi:hypothetical protein
MPLVNIRSDVFVEEQDLSQVVANINPSIGALVYASRRGRLEPQLFTTIQDWIDNVGPPDAAVSFAGYAALPFLEQSNQLWAKRAIGSGYAFGGVALQKKTSTPIALVADDQPDPRDLEVGGQGVDWEGLAAAVAVTDNLAYFYADGPGSYSADLGIQIVSDNLTVPAGVTAADAGTVGPLLVGVETAGSINIGSYSYKVTAFNLVGETLASSAAAVTVTVNGTSVYISWTPVAGAHGYKIYGRTASNWLYIGTAGAAQGYFIDYGTITPAGAPPSTQLFTTKFQVKVFDNTKSTSTAVEVFDVSMTEETDGNGRQLEIEQAINGYSKLIRVQSNAAAFTPTGMWANFSIKYFPYFSYI